MNLSQLRRALDHARVRPVKTLGQNFLHDQNLARWIVDRAHIEPQDFVVEIGPGLGALTGEILRRGARVLALEKDQRLVNFLRENFGHAHLEVRHGDALEFDLRALFPERKVKLLGNLPYYIASQLLLRYTEFPSPIPFSLLMLQDEMARRLSATPRSPDYGALTLRVQLHHRAKYLRNIPTTVFFPEPTVTSAIVRLTSRDETEDDATDDKIFYEIVRAGFSQRRKQLRKLLGDYISDWETAAERIDAAPTARAEELSREQWMKLTDLIARGDDKSARNNAAECFPVVDDRDRKIGEATRAEVHANNLRHRAIHILLFNSAGEILLQKRAAAKDRHPRLWDSSTAGHVEGNETYDETAARELKEELGVTAALELIGKLPASAETGHEFIQVYRGQCDGPFKFPYGEISAVKFFPIEIVDRWIENKPEEFAPGFLECWRMWRCRAIDHNRPR